MIEAVARGSQQRAGVIHGAGDLRLETRPVPHPQPGEALVQLRAVGICGSDLGYIRGTGKYPIRAPFVLGHEAAGVVVEAVAACDPAATSPVEPGTRVALVPGASCGVCDRCLQGLDNLCPDVRYLGSAATVPPVDGALQEYVSVPVERLQPIPDAVSDAAAALLEPLGVAEHAVGRGNVAGAAVLILGGGAIGQLAALAARARGASSVTVCETLPRRRQLALQHGADKATTPDELDALVATGVAFDAVIEATGSTAALALAVKATTPGCGRLVVVGNLPPGGGPAAEAIARSEIWVTATFRFPGRLARSLELVTSAGVDIGWLVEHTTDLDHLDEAIAAASTEDPPLKVQISPSLAVSQ